MKETLYQLDQKGNTKIWMIEVIDLGFDGAKMVIKSGRLGGSLIENSKVITVGKNHGKSNYTTPVMQANMEAQSKVNSKLREGYTKNIEEVKSSTVLGSGIPKPMLAQKYHPTGAQKGSKTLKQLGFGGQNIIVQPKLDGNRCLIKVKDGKAEMYTREGDLMPVQLEHILDELVKTQGIIDRQGIEIILDGELFSDEISFNALNGIIKRQKCDDEGKALRLKIKYHLYDVMDKAGYTFRKLMLPAFASKNILVVPSYTIVATDENINEYLEKFLAEGYEGLMIRQLQMPYENKRTWQLIKVKIFEDEEFELIGFEEDVRGDFVGSFTMRDKDGNVFNAGASGQSVEERTKMWNNQQKYVNRMATVEFFGRSEYGIPRFPKFKGFRD